LLDDDLPDVEALRFVEALSRMASMSIHGLQLVLGVKEEDLGAFRELLRGRWRLLANDIRIQPAGKKWFIPIPIGAGAALLVSPAAAVVATGTGKLVAAGALAGVLGFGGGTAVGTVIAKAKTVQECPQVEPQTCPEIAEVPESPECPECPAAVVAPPEPEDFIIDEDSGTTGIDEDGLTGDAIEPEEEDVCALSSRDNTCAKCVKKDCCSQLRACKRKRWRTCVLKKRVGTSSCQPAAIEKSCRGLALCALEYQCRASCFDN